MIDASMYAQIKSYPRDIVALFMNNCVIVQLYLLIK